MSELNTGFDTGKTLVSAEIEGLVDPGDALTEKASNLHTLKVEYSEGVYEGSCSLNSVTECRVDLDVVPIDLALKITKAVFDQTRVSVTLTVFGTQFYFDVGGATLYGIFDKTCSLSLTKL